MKTHVVEWATEPTTPARTALGFAGGIFIGIFPSFAVGSVIAFYLAGRLGLHQGAALSGTFLMNPFTAPFVYSLSYAIGSKLAGVAASPAGGQGLLASLQQLGWAFLVGNTIVAVSAATLLGLGVFFWMRAHTRKTTAEPSTPLPASGLPA